jgi:DNA-damage-inducible protein D
MEPHLPIGSDKNVPQKIEEEYGLKMNRDDARARFRKAQMQENIKEGKEKLAVPEGEMELALFDGVEVRKVLHNDEWWFSIVDFIYALTGSERANKYWADLRKQIIEIQGFNELVDKIGQLPLTGSDGKKYPTEVATTETLLRILQSVPAKKAERAKRWLAKVGFERIQEMQDPEIAIKRAIATYQIQGRSDDWIEKRIRSIVVRKELTNEWKERGISTDKEYAILTNVISTGTFGMTTVDGHKDLKGLRKQHNLRDHMTDLELIFMMLGEKSTTEIAKSKDAQGFVQNRKAAAAGGIIAGTARRQLEDATGVKVISKNNFLGSNQRTSNPELLSNSVRHK